MPTILQLMLCRGSHGTAHCSMENRHDIHGLDVLTLSHRQPKVTIFGRV
jgi:hypothetical protein